MQQNLTSALPKIYIVKFVTVHSYIPYFLEALEHIADGVRSYEEVEDSGDWFISLHFNEHPDMGHLKSVISELAISVGLDAPKITLEEAENKNWVEELSKNFQPINTGRFFIYSQFSKPSGTLIDIKINPGMAFGTGQHETTYLCLEALEFLASSPLKILNSLLPQGGDGGGLIATSGASDNPPLTPPSGRRTFKNILDLGCGSGILAIAARKTWANANITATDNDPIAVKVAAENYLINCHPAQPTHPPIQQTRHPALVAGSGADSNHQIAQQVRDDEFNCYVSEGFASIKPQKFDLILANILMNPLLEMAEDMAKFSSKSIALSGFKTEQTEKIMEKYTALGFKAERIFVKNHWVALLLTKSSS